MKHNQNYKIANRIVDGAEILFAQKGYDNISMKDIAEKAGISAGNIYHYFSGKEEIKKLILYNSFILKTNQYILAKLNIGQMEDEKCRMWDENGDFYYVTEIKGYFDESEEFYDLLIKYKYKIAILFKSPDITDYGDIRANTVSDLANHFLYKYGTGLRYDIGKSNFITILYDNYIQVIIDVLASNETDNKKKILLKEISKFYNAGFNALLASKTK